MTEVRALDAILPFGQQAIRARCFHPAGGFREFHHDEAAASVVDRFQAIVDSSPGRIALKTRTHTFTYADLDRASNRVAHALLSHPDIGDGPVGLLFENGAPFVVASLGSVKAGATQLSLEATFPRPRLEYVLQQSGATAIVTDDRNARFAAPFGRLPVINIDDLESGAPSSNPNVRTRVDHALVIDYTSGSTGRPKGVAWDHRGLLDVVRRHTNVSHICTHDGLVMFRASVRAYLSVLLNGGCYFPVDLPQEGPTGLAEWLMSEDITIYRGAVSQFRSLTRILTPSETFPRLRLILLFGESVYHTDIEVYRERFSDQCILGASLGCNELDDFAYIFVDKQTLMRPGVLPAGYSVDDVDLLVLDDGGHRRLGAGEIGEIGVRTKSCPAGYWRDADLTRTAFAPDPDGSDARVYRTGDIGRVDSDGCLVHLGRSDQQVKIRGYRVDIGEVEAALRANATIRESVVVGRDDRDGEKQLVAYVVPRAPYALSVHALRRSLLDTLPDFAVPSTFIVLDAIPLTATGKVDRHRLPAPDRTRPSLDTPLVEPRTPVEAKLADIWAEVLDLQRVGVLDSFLELGGDSLRATRVIARIVTEFQVRLPVQKLLESSTVAQMALLVVQSQAGSLEAGDLDDLLHRLDGLSDEAARSLRRGEHLKL